MKRLLTICILLLAACSSDEKAAAEQAAPKAVSPPPPTTLEARELIAASPEFGEYEFTNAGFTTPVSGAMMSEPVRQSVRELAAAGWLAVDRAGDVTLTSKSRGDKRFLLRANGLLDIIPLAKKEIGEVRSVSAQPDGTLLVDFHWRWLPNEVGRVFETGPVHDRYAAEQDGRASLMWDGTNWIVLQIE